jgi:23S rRNA pseudouridine1911/1915/1917 synthase
MPDLTEQQEENQELYEHYRFVADRNQSLLRIDKFLMTRIQNASRNKIQLAAKAGNILVNDAAVKQNYKVRPGDVISIVLTYPPRETEIIPENIPLEIVYEDKDVLVVNKEAGMVVHPAYSNYSGTLVNALAWYLQNDSPDKEPGRFPYLVHRIDKDTSGLLLVAKNEEAQTLIAKQFFDHTTERVYHALVWGDFDEDEGTIEGNISRSKNDRKIFAVYPDGEEGKEATTHYTVLERFGYVTLIECRLETGRTHQIRVHMKYAGHPLFGDRTYGGDQVLKGTTFTKYKQFVKNCFEMLPRQALHAKTLGFLHPATGKKMYFDSDLPVDFSGVLEKWRNYLKYRTGEQE